MKCAGCGIEFEQNLSRLRRKYCTTKCQEHTYNLNYNKTHDTSKYEKFNNCIACNNFRKIYGDGRCSSCRNIQRIGKARKSITGTCSRCNRGPLTLGGGICKSCRKHGLFIGNSSKTSHCELKLREYIKILYPNEILNFNYRPSWLKRKNSKWSMEIDIAILGLKLGYEYDGRPHLDQKHPGYNETIKRDQDKLKICFDNKWTLIKIRAEKIIKNIDIFEDYLYNLDCAYEDIGPMREINGIVYTKGDTSATWKI